jgi:EAL domain-containing protein (putative c-di-GMP-specific phosphodiesterase class I)
MGQGARAESSGDGAPPDFQDLSCGRCLRAEPLDFDFSMAFQPIIDIEQGDVYAYEALVRGPSGEPAGTVFESVDESNQYRFDQVCRVKAIKLAAELGIQQYLSINFMPNAVYRPELCIRTTLAAAREFGFPTERIIFEITESERIERVEHLKNIIRHYREIGFQTAIDDFGSGFAGLNLLAEFQTDLVKLDMELVRNIDSNPPRQSIVRGILQTAGEMDIRVIAEGVETNAELACLRDLGVGLFQGFLFAKPGFEMLPDVEMPRLDRDGE